MITKTQKINLTLVHRRFNLALKILSTNGAQLCNHFELKTKLFFVVAFVALSYIANSQNYSWGLKTGLDIVSLKVTGYNDINNSMTWRPSSHLEIINSFKFNRYFQINLEPGFIDKGGSPSVKFPKDLYQYGFITLPIIYIIEPLDNLLLEFGIEFGFLIYEKSNIYWGSKMSHDFSILPGVSYNINKTFNIGARFGIGLTPIYDGYYDIGRESLTYKLYNRYFEIFNRVYLFKE